METIDKTIAIISAPREYTERYFQTHVKFTQDQSSPHLSPHSHTKTQKFLPDATKIDEATKAANTKKQEPIMTGIQYNSTFCK